MRRISFAVACFGTAFLAGCLHPPVLWSPDGRWVAFTQAVRPTSDLIEPGWLFATEPEPKLGGRKPSGKPSLYRLYATHGDTGESVLLDESKGPLTSPGWNPNGTALAYGRLVSEGSTKSRFEIIVQDAPDRRRVVLNRPVTEAKPQAFALPSTAVVWSPDGHYLAAPQLQPPGLTVIRADNGRVLKEIPDAFLPSWSPDGTRLAFYRGGEPEGLYCMDTRAAEPRLLVEAPGAGGFPAPVWHRDGQSVVVVRRAALAENHVQAQLVRVRVDNGQVETICKSLFYDQKPIGPEETFSGASFDINGEDLFVAAAVEGRGGYPIISSHLRPGGEVEVRKAFNPVDWSVPIGALSVSPSGGRIALRAGAPGGLSSPALCDPGSEKLVPLVPDDAARAEWIVLLIDAARGLLRNRELLPLPRVDDSGAERPTILPAPGEIRADHPLYRRLHRLAGLGRPLCDRPPDAPPAPPALQSLIDEARLFFDYLAEDYAGALAALDSAEAHASRPEWRQALLSVRAQIFLGLKDPERATGTVAYLRSRRAAPAHQIEDTPLGPVLTEIDDASAAWSEYLAGRVEALRRGPVDAKEHGQAEPDRAFEPDEMPQLQPIAPPAPGEGRLPRNPFPGSRP